MPAVKDAEQKVAAVAVYALTMGGAELALKIAARLNPAHGAVLCLPARLMASFTKETARLNIKLNEFETLGRALEKQFAIFKGHVIIGATGLVVRLIAPLLKSKKEDPAVVVSGQDGRFAISLLSGHLGGGNHLAEEVAAITGGQAVINTATDITGCPALEMLARQVGLEIDDFSRLPAVSRVLVEGGRLLVYDPNHCLWPHLAPWPDCFELVNEVLPDYPAPMVWVDFRTINEPCAALVLRPQAIALGLGCHRGINPDEVRDLIETSLKEAGLSLTAVSAFASVETRSSEPAFLEMSRIFNKPLIIYTKNELSEVETPNPSGKVLERIGVSSVCEAAAILANQKGRLIITKKKSARATLAASLPAGWK